MKSLLCVEYGPPEKLVIREIDAPLVARSKGARQDRVDRLSTNARSIDPFEQVLGNCRGFL
jgi:hypothetical protein